MLDSPCETVLLGRIGRELALIYHDTLDSPLPSDLQELVERLDGNLPANQAGDGET